MKLFVVGAARSGTTMMARILGRHPRVHMLRELHFFEELWHPEWKGGNIGSRELSDIAVRLLKNVRDGYLSPLNPERYRTEAESLLDELGEQVSALDLFAAFMDREARLNGTLIPCNQTPRDVYYLDQILGRYPDARVVWMVRDPRAVLLSQKYRWRRMLWRRTRPRRLRAIEAWLYYHPITYSLIWHGAMQAGERFQRHERVSKVHFEQLVSEPQTTMERLMERIGLEFEPKMLNVPQVGSSHRRDRWESFGLDSTAANRWQSGGLDSAELAICERMTRQVMEQYGYVPANRRPNLLRLAIHILTWIPKGGGALLIHQARTRRPLRTLQLRLGRSA